MKENGNTKPADMDSRNHHSSNESVKLTDIIEDRLANC